MRKMFSKKQLEEMIAKAVNKGKEEVLNEIATNGVDKVNPQALVGLTHSFAELDETLQTLVESAIESGDKGVACTEPQWNKIKELLDKSLYLANNGDVLIKTYTIGIYDYAFGGVCTDAGAVNDGITLIISYDNELHVLTIVKDEL